MKVTVPVACPELESDQLVSLRGHGGGVRGRGRRGRPGSHGPGSDHRAESGWNMVTVQLAVLSHWHYSSGPGRPGTPGPGHRQADSERYTDDSSY
jgi:hypothetical protein